MSDARDTLERVQVTVQQLTEEILGRVEEAPERAENLTISEAIDTVLGPGRVSLEAHSVRAPSAVVRAGLLGRLAGRWRRAMRKPAARP